jgi:REP element-mobilizing transposase RayT
MLEPNFARAFAERRSMDQRPYTLDQPRRDVVLTSIVERCLQRGWSLIAAHVRSNHVHVIVDAEAAPERVMNDLKSYASRILNQAGFDTPDRKRWARHGSTRWLRERKNIDAAVKYVIEKQGDPMAIYCAEDRG